MIEDPSCDNYDPFYGECRMADGSNPVCHPHDRLFFRFKSGDVFEIDADETAFIPVPCKKCRCVTKMKFTVEEKE